MCLFTPTTFSAPARSTAVMLTLTPGSSCDVCAEEYGPHCLPNSIPCGHVLCGSCCSTIAEKTAPRLSPACPFCRETFSLDAVRIIRLDFNTSGWSTPRRLPNMDATSPPDFSSDAWNRRLMMADGCSRSRSDARRLEQKVARVAAKKSSVEEVTHLHKELQEWLMADPKDDDDSRSQVSALTLSAALLRAILMNHVAHSEASRLAKNAEANLKTKVDELDVLSSKLDGELKRQRLAYSQKAQECQSLRQELARLKVVPTTLAAPPPAPSNIDMAHRSQSPPPMPPVPTAYTSSASSAARLGTTHIRSASMFSRPTTPAAHLARAQTPGPVAPPRSYTPAPPRSQTPGPGPGVSRANSISLSSASAHAARLDKSPSRAQTPAPPSRASTMTPTPRHVSMTAASTPLRARTPAPVQTTAPAPRARRLSHPSPPPLAARSLSEEKYEAQALHQRWIPAPAAYDEKMKYVPRPPSRASQQYSNFRPRYPVEEDDD